MSQQFKSGLKVFSHWAFAMSKFLVSFGVTILVTSLFIFWIGNDIELLSTYANCVKVTAIFTILMSAYTSGENFAKRLWSE